MDDRVWTLSNALSFLRVLLVAPIAIILLRNDPGDRLLVVGLILLAGVTDLLDGYAARKLGQVTELGKIIDPLADKLAIGVVALLLALQGKVPAWFLAVVLLRDLAIFAGGVHLRRTRRITLQSNLIGKWAVTVLSWYILAAVIDLPSLALVKELLLAVALVMLVLSSAAYLKRFLVTVRTSETRA
jgi:CDP-diacylglycerol--glycerol-3-phosphate 3-phosphatidyltransferase